MRILYMEDDAGLARLVQKKLERAGYVVDLACNGEQGLAMCTAGSYDVIAVDQVMPVHDGLEVIRILASRGPLPPMIMITGIGDEKIAVEAMKLGVRDYIVKDTDGTYLELIPSVIENVLEQQHVIDEKQRAEEALRKQTIELNQIFNAAADGMIVIDKDFNVLRINAAFVSISGKSEAEAVGRKCYKEFPCPMCHTPQCPLSRILGGDERVECEVEKERSDGTKVPCRVAATPFRGPDGDLIGIVENISDITQLKRSEKQKLESEKLQGVIEMAGAVCHELNQPLQVVSGYSELLMMETSEENSLFGDVEEIKAQIHKMGEITKKLMQITRYKTKDYLIKDKKIIDIDKASDEVK